jgi:hydrogenase maturation protein HypF
MNDGDGVLIHATGSERALSRLLERLEDEAPPLARIESIEAQSIRDEVESTEFSIKDSLLGENRTRVTPDASVCHACREEVLNPQERRHQYPFANCTHCGPRFSIVKEVPYDRARTTMADFPMCAHCASEYRDPSDRRFHAQPIACPACGPKVWLEDLRDDSRSDSRLADNASQAEVIASTVQFLGEGAIVAIRGLGGFHLACDATNAEAVHRLRKRKARFGKPFALMARDLDVIRRYCSASDLEQELLESSSAPIVLLRTLGTNNLPAGLAPGLKALGFMMPYTPLHLLLMQKIEHPLVMTSGNLSSEPQVTKLEEARTRLAGIADVFLMHDREIANRIDDSVVKVMAGKPRMIRVARGNAPASISLPEGFENSPSLLAYGGELKSSFCLIKEGTAVMSQHQGDLEEVATFDDFQHNLKLYTAIYDHRPELLAADRHPEYLSTKLAKADANREELPLIEVQHHHAHIASCMAENGLPLDSPPVLGIALDGLGMGTDGTIWGGEFLVADYLTSRRVGSLKPIPMIGGVQAIREPWRNTYAHLVESIGWKAFAERFSDLPLFEHLAAKPLAIVESMLSSGVNTPLASSCGRLFDAVSAAIGLCPDSALFEGQGAMELETLAEEWLASAEPVGPAYPFAIAPSGQSSLPRIDPTPMWQALLDDLHTESPAGLIAIRFHRGLAEALFAMTTTINAGRKSDSPITTVALSGGCFQNSLLLETLLALFESGGIRCLTHSRLPSNDGGLALGQGVIAAATHLASQESEWQASKNQTSEHNTSPNKEKKPCA